MQPYIMNDTLPTWTDVAQVVIGVVGMCVALWTLRKLVSRDLQREAEIYSLTTIASQLRDLQVLNEKRYVESKIPHLHIELENDKDFRQYVLSFTNSNPNSKITKYTKEDNRGYLNSIATSIFQKGSVQEFSFVLGRVIGEPFYITMSYWVDNQYLYVQDLYIYEYGKTLSVMPHRLKYIGIENITEE